MSANITLTNTGGKINPIEFSSPPKSSVAPTSNNDLANKKYVDDSVGAVNVTNSTFTQPILQQLRDPNGRYTNNTALGQYSLLNYYSTSIGADNTAVGNEALKYNTTGTSNTAVSANALQFNTTGYRNTAVGYNSLPYNTTGINNTAIGYNSLPNAPSGQYNTAVGVNSMQSMSSNSQYSVAIGYDAGNSSTWGNDSYGITLLGAGTSINGVYQFSTAVGSTAQIKKSNQIVLGTANEVVTIPKFTTAGVVHNLANGDLTSSLIVAADISNNAITTSKILDSNVTSAKIADSNVTTSKIAANAITADLLAIDISYNGVLKVRDCSGGSVATQAANKKYVDDKIQEIRGGVPQSSVDTLTELAEKLVDASGTEIYARLANPVFTGDPRAPTQANSDNDTSIATTAFVKNQGYATLASPTFTGTVGGITKTMVGLGSVENTSDASKPVSSAQQTALDLKANLASPDFTGNPTAPTQDASNNSTRIATTAFVNTAITNATSGSSNNFSLINGVFGGSGYNFPTNPTIGRMVIDTTNNDLYVYIGGANERWIKYSSTGSVDVNA